MYLDAHAHYLRESVIKSPREFLCPTMNTTMEYRTQDVFCIVLFNRFPAIMATLHSTLVILILPS